MSRIVMKVEKVWKYYSNGRDTSIPVLKDVSLDVPEGEFLLIRGPSGSGKSTLLKMMGLLDKPNTGRVNIDGIETTRISKNGKAKIRNRKLGFVFQSFNLIPELTVLENVLLPSWIGRRKANRKYAIDLLRKVGLESKIRVNANNLSGGQMQRVAIARALVNRPRIILADEPTGNLDSKSAEQVLELFRKLNKEYGQTIVLVSHDVNHEQYVDRVVTMIDGQLSDEPIGDKIEETLPTLSVPIQQSNPTRGVASEVNHR